jgi:predicted Rossmann-fold nucleotide-binding protein
MHESDRGSGQPDTVVLSDEEAATKVVEGAVLGLWEVVNQLTRLRRTTRTNYRVTVFGSARRAANEGASTVETTAPGRSVGIRVDLPFEQETNPFVGQAYAHRTFFSRLHHFMLVSDAFVVMAGGIGTLLEMALAWQLLQVRRLYDVPLVLVGPMRTGLVDWGRASMLEPGHELASAVDFTIPHCVAGVEEAVSLLQAHREAWLGARAATPPA